MVMEKKNMLVKILSVVMALVMCLSFTLPVFAATSKTVTVKRNEIKAVTVECPSGILYTLGLKKTEVIVKNNGTSRVLVYLDSRFVKELGPNGSVKFKVSGTGKHKVKLQNSGSYSTSISVSTSTKNAKVL